MPKCNLNSDLEHLPKWESKTENLIRRYGNTWNIWDYRNPFWPGKFADKIIQHNIGKSFNDAYSYFCKEFKKHYKNDSYGPSWYFLKEFEPQKRYRWNHYYTDDNGLIQEHSEKEKKVYCITSDDYRTDKVHIETRHSIDKFEKVYKKEYSKSRFSSYYYPYNGKLLYYQYGTQGKLLPEYLRYRAKEEDFHNIIISGSIQYFESKQDPRFKRYHSEKAKAQRKLRRDNLLINKKDWDGLLKKYSDLCYNSIEERKRKEAQAIKREEEENLRKIIRHGFDPVTSFRQC